MQVRLQQSGKLGELLVGTHLCHRILAKPCSHYHFVHFMLYPPFCTIDSRNFLRGID